MEQGGQMAAKLTICMYSKVLMCKTLVMQSDFLTKVAS